MKTLLFTALATLALTFTASSSARADLAMRAFPGYDAPGNDIDSFLSGTQHNCETSCVERGNCTAASFEPANGRCWLKTGLPQNTHNTHSVLLIKIVAGRDGVDYPGGDYRSFQATNWQNCSRSCFIEAQCKAFAYDKNTQTCWLKNAVVDASFESNSIAGKK